MGRACQGGPLRPVVVDDVVGRTFGAQHPYELVSSGEQSVRAERAEFCGDRTPPGVGPSRRDGRHSSSRPGVGRYPSGATTPSAGRGSRWWDPAGAAVVMTPAGSLHPPVERGSEVGLVDGGMDPGDRNLHAVEELVETPESPDGLTAADATTMRRVRTGLDRRFRAGERLQVGACLGRGRRSQPAGSDRPAAGTGGSSHRADAPAWPRRNAWYAASDRRTAVQSDDLVGAVVRATGGGGPTGRRGLGWSGRHARGTVR